MQLRGHWYRGGTSKCWLFDADEVAHHASSPAQVRRLLADAFGASDARQLDGVGGGTSTTSKAAVVTPTPGGPADLDYLFAQVGIGDPTVELGSNCGNCATAIALYAVQHGLVPVGEVVTRVRMRNLNTGAVLTGTVATPRRRVPSSGTATVPGSRAAGVPVRLSFHAPWGGSTGATLPTGASYDDLAVGDLVLPATMVDAGAPAVLVPAEAAAVDLSVMQGAMADELPGLLRVRAAAGLAMGLRRPEDPPVNAVPKVGVVAPAGRYVAADGGVVEEDTHDLRVRMVSMLAPHPAIGLTSAVAVAVAAAQPGSVVAQALGRAPGGSGTRLRIGTPAGVVGTEVVTDADGRVVEVVLDRAARQLASADIEVAGEAAADLARTA